MLYVDSSVPRISRLRRNERELAGNACRNLETAEFAHRRPAFVSVLHL